MRNPPSSRPVLSPCIKCLLTRLKWKWRFYPRILINLAHLSLCSGIWEAVILALGPHPVVCGSATVLIYAVAWMQLFPVTTVARSHRDALGLNRNRIPVSFMFIAGACPWCGIYSSQLDALFLLFSFACSLFISPFSPIPPSFPTSHPRAKRRLPWHPASRSIDPIVYSLYLDTKDIKLTDQRAGARRTLINEALGGGWMEERWRWWVQGGLVMEGGRTGRLTDAQSAHQSMGTFCWACAVSSTTSLLTAAFVSHLHELNSSLGDNLTKERI